jgi:hypothetical protein
MCESLAAGEGRHTRLDGEDTMREAYHEELDSISDGLVEMANLVGSAIGLADRSPGCRSAACRERDLRRREGR